MELEQAKEKVVSYLSNQPAKLTLDYAVPFRGMWVFFFKAERRQRLAPLAVMEDGKIKQFNPIHFDYTDQEFAKAHRKRVNL